MIKLYGMLISFVILLCFFTVYSYFLVDPNITLLNNNIWVQFREFAVQQGYYHRDVSWTIFLVLLVSLYISYYLLIQNFKKLSPVKIAGVIAVITLFSYPFLSHDFFNYIFDAKIFTFYHQNPYIHKALDYPNDDWLRFMHWTHRTYPYGPVFLIISFIPSFLAMGKFILNFLFFKSLFIGSYLLGVFYLNKLNKKVALIFAIHPFMIIEGLINAHNDIVGVSLAIIGLYYLEKEKKWLSGLFLILSGGIKYITFPIIAARKNNRPLIVIIFLVQVALLAYLCIFREIQPWYFLTLFVYIPFFKNLIQNVDIFLLGLLLSYYPFIRLGEWTNERVELKHTIILVSLAVNIIFLIYKSRNTIMKVETYRKIFKPASFS